MQLFAVSQALDGQQLRPFGLHSEHQAGARGLAIEQDDLVAATYGRAFWILDDLTPLRWAMAPTSSQNEYLFAPRPAVRIAEGFAFEVGREANAEFKSGQNPPPGAILDYYLKATPREDLELEIFDQSANLIRKFSSSASIARSL